METKVVPVQMNKGNSMEKHLTEWHSRALAGGRGLLSQKDSIWEFHKAEESWEKMKLFHFHQDILTSFVLHIEILNPTIQRD